MTFFNVSVEAVESDVGLAIWEPSVEMLVGHVQDSLRLLEPVDFVRLLSPELFYVL